MNKTRMEKNKMSLCVRLCVGLTVASFGASALWAESAVYDLRFDTAYPRFLQRTEQTLWGGGASLQEVVSLQAKMHGNWIGSEPIPAVGVIYDRTEEGFAVQFQAMQGLRKVVRARFRQSGDSIVASVDRCGSDNAPIGTRMAETNFTQVAATTADGIGYGVFDIVAGTAETIADLPADADGLVINVGRLTVTADEDLTVAVPVSGDGILEYKGTGETARSLVFGKFLTAQDQVVATDTPIGALNVTAGEMGGGWCNSSGELNLEPLQEQWNDERTSFTVQFHWLNDKGYLKAVAVQFAQRGLDIVGKVIKAAQAKGAAGYGTDMLTDTVNWPENGTSIAGSATASGYGLANFAYVVTRPARVVWSGEKSLTGGLVVNACAVSVSDAPVATGTVVTVKNGGVLNLHVGGTAEGAQFVTYLLEAGSVLNSDAGYAISNGDRLFLDRATVNWTGTRGGYFNSVTADGDCCLKMPTGTSFDEGFKGDAVWSASGDGGLVVNGDVRLVAPQWTFSVVADEDVLFKGEVREYSAEGYRGMKMRKAGAGAAVFEKGCRISGALTVEGGAMRFHENASFGPLVTGGGACALSVAAGKTLAFTDSASVAWGEGRIDVECAEGACVRFGDNASALTFAQLRRVRLNGVKAGLSESGELVPSPGLRLIIR